MRVFLKRARARVAGAEFGDLFGVEVFAGSGRLTCELRRVGLGDSVGIDHIVTKCLTAPILKLDLLDPDAQKLLAQFLDNPNCVYVHLAPPYGTASRARSIPQAGQAPKPARSDRHPDGLPNLPPSLAGRVQSANKLYELSSYLFRECWDRGILVSCENPARSFMWATSAWRSSMSDIEPIHTTFHHCMWGGTRPKLTRLVHTVPALSQLAVTCCGESDVHVHEPWGRTPEGWSTSQETAYPVELCRAWAHTLREQLLSLGAKPPAEDLAASCAPLHRAAQVAVGRQPSKRRAPPLVKEFRVIVSIDTVEPFLHEASKKLENPVLLPPGACVQPPCNELPAGSRILRRQLLGGRRSSEHAENLSEPENSNDFEIHEDESPPDGLTLNNPCASSPAGPEVAPMHRVVIGIPWTPEEFVQRAAGVAHPRLLRSGLPPELEASIDKLVSEDPADIGRARCEQMRKWVARARELVPRERELHSKMPSHCAKVLEPKRLLLFKELLEACCHKDESLVADLAEGLPRAFDVLRMSPVRASFTPTRARVMLSWIVPPWRPQRRSSKRAGCMGRSMWPRFRPKR